MRTAIYCRLSKEDEDRHLESESIQNQKSLLVSYAVERGWDIYGIYCDEDYSGADSLRPDFHRMIEAARARQFEIVLCKTQSRFTRDMELVEKYIHGLFPLWGIRFVAVVDNVDTDVKGGKKARQINGLINEWYLEDLSENIRTVLDYKRRAGQYIGGFPIYGYRKHPQDKNRLVIDPAAADVVRKIYSLFLAGNGKGHIAGLLNAREVPNPTRYKQLAGTGYANGGQKEGLGLWNRTSVGRILRERMYTGDLVQGRRKKVSYKSKQLIALPREEWIIVPNTHEPIIDKAVFATVQRLLDERTRSSGTGQVHPLAGQVKCMDCGSAMVKVSTTSNGARRSYLRCKLYAMDGQRCGSHAIRLDALEEQVLLRLRGHIRRWCDPAAIVEALMDGRRAGGRRDLLDREVKQLTLEADRRGRALRELYLDKVQGILDGAQFEELNRTYLAEKAAFQRRLAALTEELGALETRGDGREELRARAEGLFVPERLSRELAVAFIDTVEVGERDGATGRQAIRIRWRF